VGALRIGPWTFLHGGANNAGLWVRYHLVPEDPESGAYRDRTAIRVYVGSDVLVSPKPYPGRGKGSGNSYRWLGKATTYETILACNERMRRQWGAVLEGPDVPPDLDAVTGGKKAPPPPPVKVADPEMDARHALQLFVVRQVAALDTDTLLLLAHALVNDTWQRAEVEAPESLPDGVIPFSRRSRL
jgi:hypothetical protein